MWNSQIIEIHTLIKERESTKSCRVLTAEINWRMKCLFLAFHFPVVFTKHRCHWCYLLSYCVVFLVVKMCFCMQCSQSLWPHVRTCLKLSPSLTDLLYVYCLVVFGNKLVFSLSEISFTCADRHGMLLWFFFNGGCYLVTVAVTTLHCQCFVPHLWFPILQIISVSDWVKNKKNNNETLWN